jgi:hypothetical protein
MSNYVQFYKEINGERWIRYAFDNVRSIDDCELVRTEYSSIYGDEQFISFAKYTMDNAYQVATETWCEYLTLFGHTSYIGQPSTSQNSPTQQLGGGFSVE